MEDKIKALEANNTWTLEFLPPGKMTIGCKWLYLIKYNSDGSIEQYDENHETGQIQAKGPSGEGRRPKWRKTKPPSGEG